MSRRWVTESSFANEQREKEKIKAELWDLQKVVQKTMDENKKATEQYEDASEKLVLAKAQCDQESLKYKQLSAECEFARSQYIQKMNQYEKTIEPFRNMFDVVKETSRKTPGLREVFHTGLGVVFTLGVMAVITKGIL